VRQRRCRAATSKSYAVETGLNCQTGRVVDQNLFTTTLLEMARQSSHQYTGRAIVIPNSLFAQYAAHQRDLHTRLCTTCFASLSLAD
jgi:hypothetical protein